MVSSIAGQIQAPHQDLPFRILDRAEELCRMSFTEHALVAAQSACELACEQVVHALIRKRQVAYLSTTIDKLLGSYNLHRDKTRELYNALAEDSIQKQRFWREYKELVELRNDIVHDGQPADLETARRLTAVARELVTHLISRLETNTAPMQG